MYAHDKNKRFARFLKRKASGVEIEEQTGLSAEDFEPKEQIYVRVFDTDRMQAITLENGKNSNLYRNHKRLLSQIEDTRGYLPLAELPKSIFVDLDNLAKRFPNFEPAIDFYKQEFALARLTQNPIFSAQPLLILGPPGVGKTFFCHELARIVGTHFEFVSMSSMTAGFVLSGNSSKWAEGSYGIVVKSFSDGQKANPIIFVDEADKVGGDNRYDPLGSLYILLEKETAKKYVDESLEMSIDASHAVWIATGNYIERIPQPIVSRFTVVEVGLPTSEQMPMVLQSVYTKIRQNHRWGDLFHDELSDSVIAMLVNSNLEPRLLQKTIIGACGKAVLKRSIIQDSIEFKLRITVDDLNVNQVTKQSKSIYSTKSYSEQFVKPEVVLMPIINISSFSRKQEPEEIMILWSVYEITETENKFHHLVGYVSDRQTGRVTSAIQHFDKDSMRLKTSSGRIYKLEGQPALRGEMRPVWDEWKKQYNIENDIDVTHQYLTSH